ncbi:hypothetical protein FA13DRAFT_534030 [Coprinellus micaceus]|uniref:Uncharacterized protein n=1 Tax=Coprinellus micaceus TaxID=71717 RepID=A0A4Y7SBC4_COPMI|nr:hypothetical protein FA13DRAFT_534030 [Coprinellus micaceus]
MQTYADLSSALQPPKTHTPSPTTFKARQAETHYIHIKDRLYPHIPGIPRIPEDRGRAKQAQSLRKLKTNFTPLAHVDHQARVRSR